MSHIFKFIIVDDEPLIRKGLLKKINSYTSHQLQCVGEADNGADAILLIEQRDPEIIFTDMRMPGMDGKQLMKIVHERFPNKKMVVISGYSDFEYMQEAISSKAINYLLKPFNREEIHQTLHKAIQQIESEQQTQHKVSQKLREHEMLLYQGDIQMITDLIMGKTNDVESVRLQSQKLEIFEQASRFALMAVYSPIPLDKQPNPRVDRTLMLAHPHSKKLYFILACFDQYEDETRIKRLIEKLATQHINELSLSVHAECCIGISLIFDQLDQLQQAHKQCTYALNQRTITDFGKYYMYNAAQESGTSTIPLWDKTQLLLYDLESGNTEKVNKHVLDLFAFYLSHPALYLYQIKIQCREIIMEVKRIIALHWKTETDLNTSSSLEAMLTISYDLPSIQSYFQQTLIGISELMKEQDLYDKGHVIENIKSYIQNHYMRDLTLDKLSALFYLNASYLSHLFKEYTTQNLTDYINEIRINHAKKLLITSNEKIYKIAKTLGYDNEKYFFRVFKKITGLTPEQYRKLQDEQPQI